MAKPVDVVAVLRGAQEYVAHCAGNCDPDYLEMVQAIAAVAELIAADGEYDVALHRMDQKMLREARIRRAAALAACKPPSQD